MFQSERYTCYVSKTHAHEDTPQATSVIIFFFLPPDGLQVTSKDVPGYTENWDIGRYCHCTPWHFFNSIASLADKGTRLKRWPDCVLEIFLCLMTTDLLCHSSIRIIIIIIPKRVSNQGMWLGFLQEMKQKGGRKRTRLRLIISAICVLCDCFRETNKINKTFISNLHNTDSFCIRLSRVSGDSHINDRRKAGNKTDVWWLLGGFFGPATGCQIKAK